MIDHLAGWFVALLPRLVLEHAFARMAYLVKEGNAPNNLAALTVCYHDGGIVVFTKGDMRVGRAKV